MAQNFIACDRDQELLLPPSLRDWLPEGRLAWFLIDAVAQLDLSAFYVAYPWQIGGAVGMAADERRAQPPQALRHTSASQLA